MIGPSIHLFRAVSHPLSFRFERCTQSEFVYFGFLPIDPMSAEAQVLIPYNKGVLDALGMAHGKTYPHAHTHCFTHRFFSQGQAQWDKVRTGASSRGAVIALLECFVLEATHDSGDMLSLLLLWL